MNNDTFIHITIFEYVVPRALEVWTTISFFVPEIETLESWVQ